MAEYPWIRREDEGEKPYTAFRTYLNMPLPRRIQGAADMDGRSLQLYAGWSAKFKWVERARAYDSHVTTAETDGLVSQLTQARDKNLELVDKLRGHLSDRLDTFIRDKQDPTVRWTQALVGMAKLEQNSFMLKDETKSTERIERIEALVERAIADQETRA